MLVLQSNKLHFAVATFDSSLAEANWRIIVTSFLLERHTVGVGVLSTCAYQNISKNLCA